MKTILLDFETTGLTAPSASENQPYIIEVGALDYESGRAYSQLIKPPFPFGDETTKITGITNEDVKNSPSFIQAYRRLAEFCLGAERWVAHNIAFDSAVLLEELKRYSLEYRFPWPLEQFCTYEAVLKIPAELRPEKSNLGALYQHVTGKKLENAHRAMDDVRALVPVYEWIEDHLA